MTSLAWLFLSAAGIAALGDWSAVTRKDKRVEYVAKPATLIALLLTAVALEPDVDAMRAWFVVALVFSLLGDVFLMLPRDRFVQGLTSFLVAHLAYVAGFFAGDIDKGRLAVAGPLVALAILFYARFLIGHMTGRMRVLRIPVALYALAIGTMLASAVASGPRLAIVGAALFVISDGLIGYSRFVRMRPWAPLAIIVTYHLGQMGLVLALGFP